MMTIHEYKEKFMKNEIDLNKVSESYARYFKDNVKVGDGATICYWSDRHAGTVIKKTKCTITVQRDNAKLDPAWKPEFIPGGFVAHCVNQYEQKWTYEPDKNGSVYVAYWSEKKCGYYAKGLHIVPGRHEFYDYNF